MLTSVSGSEEEEKAVQVGEPVTKVLNEADPAEKSRLLINPTLAFSGRNPKGHPSSYTQNGFAYFVGTNSIKEK